MSLPNFKLNIATPYRDFFSDLALKEFHDLINYVESLPYGRTSSRNDFSTLFTEGRGTCSLKHGLLSEVAMYHEQQEIELMVGIFMMNAENMPKVQTVLAENKLKQLPEAHCYLRYKGKRYDFTSRKATPEDFESFLLREQRCEPTQVGDWKPSIHKDYLTSWAKRRAIGYTPEELWKIREQCIQALGN